METKRLVIAFALSAAVLIGWTIVFPPPKAPHPAARPAAKAAAGSAASAAPAPAPGTAAGAPVPPRRFPPRRLLPGRARR